MSSGDEPFSWGAASKKLFSSFKHEKNDAKLSGESLYFPSLDMQIQLSPTLVTPPVFTLLMEKILNKNEILTNSQNKIQLKPTHHNAVQSK